tara:strand:- start:6 stop:386 length:381 start_codon:yes stop_codon:yes gene_type:complete
MKKFLLLLIIPFLIFSQEPSLSEPLLTINDLLDSYPNAVAGYYDKSGEILFDGGSFDAKSLDVEKVDQYRALLFSGEMFNSSAAKVVFWAFPDGTTKFQSVEFVTENNEAIFSFFKGKGGSTMMFE